MPEYQNVFQKLDLSKNEGVIYEYLLKHGESPVGKIATGGNINRRNVYDSLNRLIEKGLVFEIIEARENRYQAVDPKKLMEIVKEKEEALSSVMPDLQKLYGGMVHENEVFIYKGYEGWKNYIRDIIRIGEDDYVIGGRGQWAEPKLRSFMESAVREMKKKGIELHGLLDPEVKEKNHEIVPFLKKEAMINYRFLPKGFSTKITIAAFGDRAVFTDIAELGNLPEDIVITVIVNRNVADAFRTWFKLLWEMSDSPIDEIKKKK